MATNPHANLPRVLLMGPRRAGKSSIKQVVFNKMSPHETLFRLEGTMYLDKRVIDGNRVCQFQIWDFPGDYGDDNAAPLYLHHVTSDDNQHPQFDVYDPHPPSGELPPSPSGGPLSSSSVVGLTSAAPLPPALQQPLTDAEIFAQAPLTALVFVIDAQDEPYDHVLARFADTVNRAFAVNQNIMVEVFINKVDGELFLSDEAKYDCRRDIMSQVSEELSDPQSYPLALIENLPISYYLTSIYDHSIFEAFSKVCQKLIPPLPTLESLLNILSSSCSLEKAFLFDVVSKLYIATDTLSPVDVSSYELCSDMIDVVLDVSGIYGSRHQPMAPPPPPAGAAARRGSGPSSAGDDGSYPFGAASPQSHDDGKGGGMHLAARGRGDSAGGGAGGGGGTTTPRTPASGRKPNGGEDDGMSYDAESSSVIRLSNGMILYLREVDSMLALVCLTRGENFKKKSLVDYNIGCFKEGLRRLMKIYEE